MMYYGRKLMRQMGIRLAVHSYGNIYEYSLFKIGFSGVRQKTTEGQEKISLLDKAKLAVYYGREFLTNPGYLNSSLFDSAFAYWSLYHQSSRGLHWVNLFEYIPWVEDEIISLLTSEYNWEKEKDTVATWRIDDGTAQFYNYIYMVIAGFTEFDTFRSIQIRDGVLEREEALEIVKEENKPRIESIEWYADTIGFDCNQAIRVINAHPKLYRL
jgi:hypothetical protein